jgi:gamma-glutamylputrescine oxidase
VAILGAGFTGLWAALTLARAGRSVVVLDAHRVGFGASGRNGGQVNLGFNKSQQELEAKLGEDPRPRALGPCRRGAQAVARFLCNPRARGRLPPRRGLCGIQPRAVAELEAEAAFLDRRYGFDLEVMDRDSLCRIW